MREKSTRILLVVAPSKFECFQTAKAFELDMLCVAGMRFVSNAYLLRGWSRGTPFIARGRDRWSTDAAIALDRTLDVLLQTGQLRIANDQDLQRVKEDVLI